MTLCTLSILSLEKVPSQIHNQLLRKITHTFLMIVLTIMQLRFYIVLLFDAILGCKCDDEKYPSEEQI